MQDSLVMFTSPFLTGDTNFWENLVPKFEIVSLSWNLAPRLIRIWRTQWRYLFFFVFDWKYFSWGCFFQKSKIAYWSWNLEPRLIRIYITWWQFSSLSFLDWKYLFWLNLVQKFKIVSLSWNSVPISNM